MPTAANTATITPRKTAGGPGRKVRKGAGEILVIALFPFPPFSSAPHTPRFSLVSTEAGGSIRPLTCQETHRFLRIRLSAVVHPPQPALRSGRVQRAEGVCGAPPRRRSGWQGTSGPRKPAFRY